MKIDVHTIRGSLSGERALAEVFVEGDNVILNSGTLDSKEIQAYAEKFIEAFDELMGLLPADSQYEIMTQSIFKHWYDNLKEIIEEE